MNQRTFFWSFRLVEPGSDSIGRMISVESEESGRIIGVWLESEALTGSFAVNDLFEKLLGKAFLQRRAGQVLAYEEGFTKEGA